MTFWRNPELRQENIDEIEEMKDTLRNKEKGTGLTRDTEVKDAVDAKVVNDAKHFYNQVKKD